MNKRFFLLYSIIILLVASAFFTGCKNTYAVFNVPSEANMPTIMPNSKIHVSKEVKPKMFDFICFRTDVAGRGESTVVFRLCGLPGDVVEIRDGILMVNNKTVDDQFDLLKFYRLPKSTLETIADSIDFNTVWDEGDSLKIQLSSKFIHRNHLPAKLVTLDKNEEDIDMRNTFHQNWNSDHFGPIKVPAAHYFVLGDNRRGANDSRYLGFIPKEKFVATVINVH